MTDSRWLILSALLMLMGCSSHENEVYYGLGRADFTVTVEAVEGAPALMPMSLYLMSENGEYSHDWHDVADYSPYESLHVGGYVAIAYSGTEGSEGYGCQYYEARTSFEVLDSEVTHVDLTCRLTQAMARVALGRSANGRYSITGCVMHASQHGYVTARLDSPEYMYLQPGSTYLYVTIADTQGRTVNVVPDMLIETHQGERYDILAEVDDDDDLIVSCGGRTASLRLSDQLFVSAPPQVSCSGFTEGIPLNLTEGFPAETPVMMDVHADAGIRSMILTVATVPYKAGDYQREFNLLDPASRIFSYGLRCSLSGDDAAVIDYTTLLESLKADDNTDLYFILQVMDGLGRVSAPAILHVILKGVEVTVTDIQPAMVGVDTTTITLGINVPKVDIKDFSVTFDDYGSQQSLEVLGGSLDVTDHTVTLSFVVPQGIEPVDVDVYYMGLRKMTVTVPRRVPDFKIKADAFATQLRLSLIGADDDITSSLTRYATVSIKDTDFAVTTRDPDNGLIVCSGLTPATRYEGKVSVIKGDNEQSLAFVTESATQLPDGDFEDAELALTYGHLASGGVYSTTTFPIYSRQNYVDINVYWPKKSWTSINAKTFCRGAANRNTWFMQPSAYIDYGTYSSGSKSMCVTSVGWSLVGKEIPPYVQSDDAYQPYSGNVPEVDRISAGYLFLGSYSFNQSDKSESYIEGIAFNSRPSSLNGFYRYTADVNNIDDRGWCKVQLIHTSSDGSETVVAHGFMEFSKASYFRAFNLPLAYYVYDMAVDKVKVTFCSSYFSDGLTYDDPDVPVSADVSEACFRGSTLWIDNLSFSY